MNSINDVRKILDAKLQSIDGLPEIETENGKVKPIVGARCRSTILPSRSVVATISAGCMVRLQGLYQVDLFYPAGLGTDVTTDMADAIVNAFFPGQPALTDENGLIVTITSCSQMAARVTDKLNYQVPLVIEWFAYVSKA